MFPSVPVVYWFTALAVLLSLVSFIANIWSSHKGQTSKKVSTIETGCKQRTGGPNEVELANDIEQVLLEGLRLLRCRSIMLTQQNAQLQRVVTAIVMSDGMAADSAEAEEIDYQLAEDASIKSCLVLKKCCVETKHGQQPYKMCVPVHAGGGKVYGILQATYHAGGLELFDKRDEDIFQFIASSCGYAFQIIEFRQQAARVEQMASCVKKMSKSFSLDNSVEISLGIFVKCLYDVLQSDLITLYLCDHVNEEAWICISKDGLEGLTVKYGQGIAGTVAMSGETLLVNDAYADPRFCATVDEHTGMITRNMLCIGVPGLGKDKKPLAVLQIINKANDRPFNQDDEKDVTHLVSELSKMLRDKLYELNLFKKSSYLLRNPDRHEIIALECGLLETYGRRISKSSLTHFANDPSPSGSISPTKEIQCRLTVEIDHLFSWEFRPFGRDISFLTNCLGLIFERFECLSTLNLTEMMLQKFFSKVVGMYRKEVPFHNFEHAWSVCHITSMILIDSGMSSSLSPISIIGALIASLCHDLDHPGNSNAFEVAARSDIALTYSDDAVLERHHTALTHRVLAAPQHDLFANLTRGDQLDMRYLITSCIMGTEMSKHFEHIQHIQAMLATDFQVFLDVRSQTSVSSHIVHCADLSGQVFEWDVAQVWGKRCIAEFQAQSAEELRLGFSLTPFMQNLEDKKHAMLLQSGFIDTIVLPLWKALADCFPRFEGQVAQCVQNSLSYKNEALVD